MTRRALVDRVIQAKRRLQLGFNDIKERLERCIVFGDKKKCLARSYEQTKAAIPLT